MFSLRPGCLLLLAFTGFAEIPAPPGRMVDTGGFKLHINCSGAGSPAVVLEAGFPGSSLDWTLVQPVVAEFTTVCSYDRAGLGWSEKGAGPRSSSEIAEELRTLLTKADVPGPYVLVGHSLGGLYARAFVRKFPTSVIGMVLVDATHEDQWDFETSRHWEVPGHHSIQVRRPEVQRPPAAAAILKEMWATEAWKAAEQAERNAIKLTVSEAQRAAKRLPAIPVIVLSAGSEIGWNDDVGPQELKGQQLQREMAALSPLGKWVPVPGANHYIHLSQPAVVVDAIRQVVQAARAYRKAQ
jgi:pimeloyl-ACP methyl ester carboxylesterase